MRITYGYGERRYVAVSIFRKFFWLNTKFPFIHYGKLINPNFFQRWVKNYLSNLIEHDSQVRHALVRVQLSYDSVTFEDDGSTRIHWRAKKK
jgi:hypothetical protein